MLRKRWRAGTISEGRFAVAVRDLEDIDLERYPVLRLMRRAFELRANVTPYDAAYVALAGILGCELSTARPAARQSPRPLLPHPGPELIPAGHLPGNGAPMAAAGGLPLPSAQAGTTENYVSRAQIKLSNGAAPAISRST